MSMKLSEATLKKLYEILLETDQQMIQEIRECDTKVIVAFRKYYQGSQNEMEAFRDEIFGILLEEKKKSFCQGAKLPQIDSEECKNYLRALTIFKICTFVS